MVDHLRTASRNNALRRVRLLVAVIALAATLALLALPAVASALRAQGAASIREAVLRAAGQCCAVEGSYPSTLQHLEDRYGLSVNHDDYVILYEAFASNVVPSVVVIPR